MKNHVVALVLCGILLVTAGVSPGRSQPAESYEILLQSGNFIPAPGMSADDGEALAARGEEALLGGKSRIHALVQLYDIPAAEERRALAGEGVELLTYIPDYAWIASIPAERPERAATLPEVRWVGDLKADDKLQPELRDGYLGDWAFDPATNSVLLLVLLHKDVSLADGRQLVDAYGGEVVDTVSLINTLVIDIDAGAIYELANEDIVEWVEQPLPPLEELNNNTRARVGANTLQASVSSGGYGLDGAGVDALVYDTGLVYKHTDLKSHMTYGNTGKEKHHATHVAGTLCGDGSVKSWSWDKNYKQYKYKGIAPKAHLLSMGWEKSKTGVRLYTNPGDIKKDFTYAKNTWSKSADLLNGSIGVNVGLGSYPCSYIGNYGPTSLLLDSIVRGSLGEPFIMAWAAGNERGQKCGSYYRTIAPPTGAKNPIHTGATDRYDSMSTFSSWGPTDDGRLKPIVCAPGVDVMSCSQPDDYYLNSGTSMASPVTAGTIALMLQQYRKTYKTTGEFLPSTAKAILIHTAVDLGTTGPDYKFGYGRIDGVNAVKAIVEKNFYEGTLAGNGEVHQWDVTIKPGTKELKVSLAWDDPPGSLAAAKKLVNDLDLRVFDPFWKLHHPYVLDPANPSNAATKGVDSLNNQEQVVVTNPTSGIWNIRVKASTLPKSPQSYSIVISGVSPGAPKIDPLAQWPTPTPTATPDKCGEALINGGFESGTTGWSLWGGPRSAVLKGASWSGPGATSPHGGKYYARVGGKRKYSYDVKGSIYQKVSIPANATGATLSYWIRMKTEEAGYQYEANKYIFDYLDVEIQDRYGKELTNLQSLSNADTSYTSGWKKETFSLSSAYAGKTIRISFRADVDQAKNTWWFIDDVSLNVCTSGGAPAPPYYTPTPTFTPDPRGPWPMFGHDARRTFQSTYKGCVAPSLKWSYEMTASPYSAVIGTAGHLYVSSGDNSLWCLNSDGSFSWKYTTGGWLATSPAIGSGESIYLASNDNSLYCLNSDGSLSWKYTTGEIVYLDPVLDNSGNVYVGSRDNNLYCLTPAGTVSWSYPINTWVLSSPALSPQGRLYAGSSDNRLYGLNSDGSLAWSYVAETAVQTNAAVGHDGKVYAGFRDDYSGGTTKDGYLCSLNSDGSLSWTYPVPFDDACYVCAPVGPSDSIYATTFFGASLYSVNQKGKLLYDYELRVDELCPSPCKDATGRVFTWSGYPWDKGNIFSLYDDSTLDWSYRIGEERLSMSVVMDADGTVYSGSEDNIVFALSGPTPTMIPTWTPVPTSTPASAEPWLGYGKLLYGPPVVWINPLLPPPPWGPDGPLPYGPPHVMREQLESYGSELESLLYSTEGTELRQDIHLVLGFIERGLAVTRVAESGDLDQAGMMWDELTASIMETCRARLETEAAMAEEAGDWPRADEIHRQIQELEEMMEAAQGG